MGAAGAVAGTRDDADVNGSGIAGAEMDIEAESVPLAIELSAGAWYRYTYDKHPALDEGHYLQGGAVVSINAAYGRAGAYLEWVPATFLQLQAEIDRYEFFGQYGSLLTYDDPSRPFGDRTLKAQQGGEQSGHGHRLLLQPTVEAALGAFILTNEANFAFYQFSPDGAPSGPYFWELEYDTLLKKWDRLLTDELSLTHEFSRRPETSLLIGPYYEVVRAMGADIIRQRVGVTVYYESSKSSGYRNRYYFQAGVNTEDRNVEGQAFLSGGVGVDFDLR